MTRLITIILLLIAQLSVGQNLVPNPSFELYSPCPSGLSSVVNATGWTPYRDTPDYFNTCTSASSIKVPKNNMGYQFPKTGNAYCGGSTFNKFALFREIIGIQLSTPLTIGLKYFVTFYVSLSGNPGLTYATKKMGAKFFKTSFTSSANPVPINNTAQVFNNTFITDTTNWQLVSGSFIADSAYKYVAIGNFFDDFNTDTFCINNSAIRLNGYYYIDDVCVSTDSNHCATWTNIIDPSDNDFKIKTYPNPSSLNVTLEFNNHKKENCTLTIYNIQGLLVQTLDIITAEKIELEIKHLTKGIYFLHLQTSGEIKATGKLIVE